jgi:transcriptional regulator with XRE-family HTH domain
MSRFKYELSFSLGDKLKGLRKGKLYTQKVLSELSGIAEPTIRKYESGQLNPKIETLQKLATALECPLHELVDPAIVRSLIDSLTGLGISDDSRVDGDLNIDDLELDDDFYRMIFDLSDEALESITIMKQENDTMRWQFNVVDSKMNFIDNIREVFTGDDRLLDFFDTLEDLTKDEALAIMDYARYVKTKREGV